MKEILTNMEAAKYLGICTKELKRLVDNGDIPYLDFGAGRKFPRRRYHKSDLEGFIEQTKTTIRKPQCQSTSAKTESTITTSGSVVLGFMAALEKGQSAKPRHSKTASGKAKSRSGQLERNPLS